MHIDVVFILDRTGSSNIFPGTATLVSKNKSILNYQADSRLPNVLSRMLPTTGLYHIMYSDYKNYTVLWSCTSFGLFHTGNSVCYNEHNLIWYNKMIYQPCKLTMEPGADYVLRVRVQTMIDWEMCTSRRRNLRIMVFITFRYWHRHKCLIWVPKNVLYRQFGRRNKCVYLSNK